MHTLIRWSVVAVAATLVSGCTYMHREEANDTENTLAAAGFRMKLADTPAKLAKLQAITPVRKVITGSKDGHLVYLYADPEFCKCLYSGTEQQYDRYRQLALQKQIAQEQIDAAEMNENTAMDWGMWGPFW